MSECFIIAELSANHNKDFKIAEETLYAAKEAGADAFKMQTYTAETLTIDCDNDYFKIKCGSPWDGKTLFELYQEASTPWDWFPKLKEIGDKIGIIVFSTPFDKTAVDYLEEFGNPILKIASFEISDIPLIEYAASKNKPMIISTGIAELDEIQDAVTACRKMGNNNITLLKCTSAYPAPIEEANLLTMVDMKQKFNVQIGLSDHCIGNDVSLASVALGATMIERHFILNKKISSADASFSLLPNEFKQMVLSIRNIEKALGSVNYNLSPKIKKNKVFSRSIFAISDIKKGEIFTEDNIRIIRPGFGLKGKKYKEIIGTKSEKDYQKGTPIE